jgi:hypothetical protein
MVRLTTYIDSLKGEQDEKKKDNLQKMLEERHNALCEELARKRMLERKKNRQTQVPYDDEAITLNFGTTSG